MDSTTPQNWSEVLTLTFDQLLQQLIIFTPKLIGVIALLIIGWLVAIVLAKLARSAIAVLNKILTRVFPNFLPKTDATISKSYTDIVGRVIFWLVFLFFVAASANSLGLNIVSNWMGQLLLYLPRLAAGLLIMIGGYLAGNIVKVMVTSAADSAGFKQTELLGRSVQVAVFFTAVVIGIEQLGINIQFFTQFVIVIGAVILFGFSLAFGLGARELIANVIGAQQAQKHWRIGDEIMIGNVEGVLIEIASNTLVVETAQGRTTIPAKLFLEHVGHVKSPSVQKAQT